MKVKFHIPIVLSIFLAACNSKSDEVKSIIERNNARLSRWYLSGQCDSISDLFVEDAWQMSSNSVPLVGRDAIKNHIQTQCDFGSWFYTFSTENVEYSVPVAVERGVYRLQFFPGPGAPSNMKAFRESGSYISQWRLVSGRWLIVNTVASKEAPLR